MTTPTDYPDRVRALLEAATPGPWRGDRYDGTVKYRILAGPEDAPITVLLVDHKNGTYGFGCYDDGPNAEHPDADERLVLEAPTLARAYLAACEEVERLNRVLRVEQGDVTFARGGWSHDIDLTDDGAVREYVWTGPSAYVRGSPNDGWRIESAHTGRIVKALYDTALEAMEAADRAAGGAA